MRRCHSLCHQCNSFGVRQTRKNLSGFAFAPKTSRTPPILYARYALRELVTKLKRFQRFQLGIGAWRRLGIFAAWRLTQDKPPCELGRLCASHFKHKISRLVDVCRKLATTTGHNAVLAAQAESNLGLVLQNPNSDIGSESVFVEPCFHFLPTPHADSEGFASSRLLAGRAPGARSICNWNRQPAKMK
ncbi:hypothetical protein BRCON_2685 [Candidatus Sumerlaea chitinivorans]|uniref:Uncharacterized protein n=1 Tax=Sumerlaea chitinivorans TaxID=2250252 RepID=A0A2Z4Y845_SUMC1|nr:hypothetical protein BRCON_2685 [Candidatus Sumerlaea chitinivorans]